MNTSSNKRMTQTGKPFAVSLRMRGVALVQQGFQASHAHYQQASAHHRAVGQHQNNVHHTIRGEHSPCHDG